MAKKWTATIVASRIEEAAAVMKRLPEIKQHDLRSAWPPILRDFWETYGLDPVKIRMGPPTADGIQRMDEVLDWLLWLEPEQTRLVWSRAEGVPWKVIMRKIGVSRSTAWRLWSSSMAVITTRLNVSGIKCVDTRC